MCVVGPGWCESGEEVVRGLEMKENRVNSRAQEYFMKK